MNTKPMIAGLPRAILAQHLAVLGKTGAGKSSVLRVLVEELLRESQPVCIIDPKGDWWGLKSSADGKKPGFPVIIFGGSHADIPITEHSGAQVGELVATGNRPCIIDFGGWEVGPRTRFFIEFASALFRHATGQRWLVIDEVHNFAPQGKVLDPAAGKALHWANRLASEGRGKGVQLMVASQRPQKVHKDLLTSCETLVAMRVIHPLDRKAVKEWIDGCPEPGRGTEVLNSLASMGRGTGWVWSPEIGFGPRCVDFPLFSTYDSFKPSIGAAVRLQGWADTNLDEVRTTLAQVVKEAEASDPKRLHAEIAQLRRDLAKAQRVQPTTALPPERVEVPMLTGDERAAIENLTAHLEGNSAIARQLAADSAEQVTLFQAALTRLLRPAPPISEENRKPLTGNPNFPRATIGPLKTWPPDGSKHEGISGVSQRILNALAELEALGSESPEKELVALLAGYSNLSSKGFANAISGLKTAGAISYPASGLVALTDQGRANAQAAAAPRSTVELQSRLLAVLGGASERILRPIIDAYPDSIEKTVVAEAAGYGNLSSKGFANAVSRLRTLGFIDYPSPGQVVARPVLFLEARR